MTADAPVTDLRQPSPLGREFPDQKSRFVPLNRDGPEVGQASRLPVRAASVPPKCSAGKDARKTGSQDGCPTTARFVEREKRSPRREEPKSTGSFATRRWQFPLGERDELCEPSGRAAAFSICL